MADPLSVTASLLAVSTVAIKTVKSLYETVKRYRDRDKTLRRLQDELNDLTKILESLTGANDAEESILALLRDPIERCSQICHDFELAMEVFSRKSRTGFRDWTRMEFMRGDINEFIETVAGYKSTISVGLGTITMHTSKVSQQVLLEYNEMIQDTTYNLELHLQRIDEKMTQLTTKHDNTSGARVDLTDEREVTRQCLRICEEARLSLENLSTGAASLLGEAPQSASQKNWYDAQVQMRQTLDETRDSFTQTSGHLLRRLESLVQDHTSDNGDRERLRLQSDIEISKQCLDVCNVASEISRQKIYRIGEVVADGDSDQVVVTTLADLFDIGKAVSTDSSAQLLGSMSAESLRHLTDKRYSSRFGAIADGSKSAESGVTTSRSTFDVLRAKKPPPRVVDHEQIPELKSRENKPSSNEIRKRVSDGDVVRLKEAS